MACNNTSSATWRDRIVTADYKRSLRVRIRHVIFDRDGVLNRESGQGYVARAADWHWEDGALEGLRTLARAGVRLSIATNQSGVGRGLMSPQALAQIHERMLTEAAAADAAIDAVFVCAHAPESDCSCRKPKAGLVHSALAATSVSAADTVLVGDDLRDVEAAWAAGVAPVLVRTGKGRDAESRLPAGTVPVYDDLKYLAEAVLSDAIVAESAAMQAAHRIFFEHARVVEQGAAQLPRVLDKLVTVIWQCLARGNKVLACGNGGSAADAQHLVAELVGRFRAERQALAAIALTADSTGLTAIANDYGYEQVFARQVEALGRSGDVLLAISTSGNSANVVAAAIAARARGCTVVALTGAQGGKLAAQADLCVAAPSTVVARIQEVHTLCIHVVAEAIDALVSKASQP
jgi:D-sedoheptulose 7-phosphate isomerase